MKKPTVLRLLEFQQLLHDFAEIERVIHIKRRGNIVLESDTEHSYNLALTAWFIADYFPELDKHKIIELALVHDLVELHAGDTYAFADQALLDSKKEREEAARQQLNKDWPDFGSLHKAIADYESRATPEVCFVYALDKLMPMLVIYMNDGYTWIEKQLTLERLNQEKVQKMSVSAEVFSYWDELYALLSAKPDLFHS